MPAHERNRPEPEPVDATGLRETMRRLIGGVAVITAGIGDERTGFTATSAFGPAPNAGPFGEVIANVVAPSRLKAAAPEI